MESSTRFRRIEGGIVGQTKIDHLPLPLPDKVEPTVLPAELTEQLSNRLVVARVGAYEQFNDIAAQKGIVSFLEQNKDAIFVAVNTKPFTDNNRVLHYPYLDSQQVFELYRRSFSALNGRRMGESFGYSIFEPLLVGTPVAAPGLFRNPLMDKNHLSALADTGLIYNSSAKLVQILNRLKLGDWKMPSSTAELVEEAKAAQIATKLDSLIRAVEN
jgi:hypothetical protein